MIVKSTHSFSEKLSLLSLPFSQIKWFGRQVSILKKNLFSSMRDITDLFYQIITKHVRKSLLVFTTTLAISVLYPQRKLLIHFLKTLCLGTGRSISEKKAADLVQQSLEEQEKIQKILPNLENTILSLESVTTAIITSQHQLLYKTTLIKKKYSSIKKNLINFNQPLPKIAFCEKSLEQLQTRAFTLQGLKTDMQNLITEAQKLIVEIHLFTKDYPDHFNPFTT